MGNAIQVRSHNGKGHKAQGQAQPSQQEAGIWHKLLWNLRARGYMICHPDSHCLWYPIQLDPLPSWLCYGLSTSPHQDGHVYVAPNRLSHQAREFQGSQPQTTRQHLWAKASRLHMEQLPCHQATGNQLQVVSYWWLRLLPGRRHFHCLRWWWNLPAIIRWATTWHHQQPTEHRDVHWRSRPSCGLYWS